MTQTLNVEARRPLTRSEIEAVQALVDQLTGDSTTPAVVPPKKTIDWAAVDALFAGRQIGGDKTSVELVHEGMTAWADEMDRT